MRNMSGKKNLMAEKVMVILSWILSFRDEKTCLFSEISFNAFQSVVFRLAGVQYIWRGGQHLRKSSKRSVLTTLQRDVFSLRVHSNRWASIKKIVQVKNLAEIKFTTFFKKSIFSLQGYWETWASLMKIAHLRNTTKSKFIHYVFSFLVHLQRWASLKKAVKMKITADAGKCLSKTDGYVQSKM